MIMLSDTPADNAAAKYTEEQLGGIIGKAQNTLKIRSINTSAWMNDNKTNFQASLTSLKTEIDNYLNAHPGCRQSGQGKDEKDGMSRP